MKRSASLLATLCLALAACGEKDPGPTKNEGFAPTGEETVVCDSISDCPFGTTCQGGICASTIDPPTAPEPCTEDADCPERELCAVSTGLCVPAAAEPTPNPDAEPDCQTGETRPCGSKVGACEYGTQYCLDGGWEPSCHGGVGPTDEICNGVDDDCNGIIDEEADASCDDGTYCNGVESCQGGGCVLGAAPNCSSLDGACVAGVCDEANEDCATAPRPNDDPCEDGLFCTVDDSCQSGACQGGEPRQCSASGGSCRDGVCDEDADACTGTPVTNGTPCDDGLFCRIDTTCQDGECAAGSARDCSSSGDQCNDGTCDEPTSACKANPKPNGTGCTDDAFCTVDTVCTEGTCAGGSGRDCSVAADVCNYGTCDESADACEPSPRPTGTSCSDGYYCTVGDSCQGGSCEVGAARDCSSSGDQCNDGACNETANACEPQPKTNGTGCNDGLWCKVSDVCTNGLCGGSDRDCASAGDQCNDGICNEIAGACEATPKPNGIGCDDTQWCTVADNCTSGSCTGTARDCSGEDDQCNDGVCNDTSDACQAVPKTNGTACDDGLWCNIDESCTAGNCSGGAERTDCTAPSCAGWCDEDGDRCVCDACLTGTPTADAGPDQDAVPDETMNLNATGSTDPTSQGLTYAWRVESRPSGSTAPIANPSGSFTTILADVSGEFEICLRVTDTDGCVSDDDCMTITVAPQVKFHVELVWDTDKTDVDVHYRVPGGAWFAGCGTAYDTDAYFICMHPDWGPTGPDSNPANDPGLDVDNVLGYGPENINQDLLFDGNPFTIGVHYYQDKNGGLTRARIRVYVDGVMALEDYRYMTCGDFWEVADVQVSGNGTTVALLPNDSFWYFGGPGCEWTCDPSYYYDGWFCDCGCRVPDPDCWGGGSVDSCVSDCDFCF